MNKYIDADKLKKYIENKREIVCNGLNWDDMDECQRYAVEYIDDIYSFISSLQHEQPANMIQWTGNNLKEVIELTGKSPRFEEWFKSWEEFETYVHQHNDILYLFCENGSRYEVSVGAWIIKTPDGHNVPSTARFIPAKQEQPEVDLEEEIEEYLDGFIKMPTREYFRKAIKYFYSRGLNARKEESK